jgi:hypothetical protein
LIRANRHNDHPARDVEVHAEQFLRFGRRPGSEFPTLSGANVSTTPPKNTEASNGDSSSGCASALHVSGTFVPVFATFAVSSVTAPALTVLLPFTRTRTIVPTRSGSASANVSGPPPATTVCSRMSV